jgi:hypothetical protein
MPYCKECEYSWTDEEWDAGKGRVAFTLEDDEIVCCLCHTGEEDFCPCDFN